MKIFRIQLILAISLILCSCAVGPDYVKPDLNAPERFVLQDVLSTLNRASAKSNSSNEININWWEGYKDPVIDLLVTDGIENNYSVARAAARLKETYAFLELAGAGDDPSVIVVADPNITSERELDNGNSSDTEADVFGLLSVVIPLDIFGRTKRETEAARARIEEARADLRGTVLEISTDIVSRYLRLRGDQRQLELLLESVALQDKTLFIVTSRYKAGLSPELDVRRAEATVENLRADIPGLEESITNSQNALATLTGRYPGAHEQILSESSQIPHYRGVIPELIPADVLMARPDVQQAEADLKRAMAEIGVAEADYYPTLQLAGQISIGSAGIVSEQTISSLVVRLALLIEQVVFDGGARRANVDIAKARAEQALADYRQSLLDASQQVEETLAALKSSYDRQQSLQKAVDASKRSFHQAEILYQQGLTSFLDVVDSQRVLANAEQDLASATTDYSSEIATLFRVLGTQIDAEANNLTNTQ